jgi:hypothetical protein
MNKKKFNPFTEQVAGKYFVGREGQLDLFITSLNGLKNNITNHLYIAGIHGTGKTSFIGRISEITKEHGLFAANTTLDSDKSGYEHINSIIRSVVKSLQESQRNISTSRQNFLNDFDKGENSEFFKFPKSKSLSNDIIKEDLETIKKLLINQGRTGIVICIDEGQRIEPSALSTLKNTIQSIDCFLVIISLRIVNSKGGISKAGRIILDKKAEEGEGDYGASRMFVNNIEIGPFETEKEAFDCVTTRLVNNAIQFEADVIREIIHICEKIPREIISLCSNLYNHSQEENIDLVNTQAFIKIIKKIYDNDFVYIEGICSSIPQSQINILSILSQNDNLCISEIARLLFPNIDILKAEYIINGIERDLIILNENFKIFRVDEQNIYSILNPIHKFIIKLYTNES